MSLLLVSASPDFWQREIPTHFPTDLSPNNPNVFLLTEEGLSLGIDTVRRLQKWVAIKSTSSDIKLAIIPAAEKLTIEAQNALLKTLEEPPEGVQIILQTKNLDTLLPTVVSRCQIVNGPIEKIKLTPAEKKELTEVLNWIEADDIRNGFFWAKNQKGRAASLEIVDKLLVCLHEISPLPAATARKILKVKKYLAANTNVRLTLENLFLN